MEIIILENGQKMQRVIVGNTEILTPYQEEKPFQEPTIVDEEPTQIEIDFAEYVIATEDKIAQLENLIKEGVK